MSLEHHRTHFAKMSERWEKERLENRIVQLERRIFLLEKRIEKLEILEGASYGSGRQTVGI